MTKNIQKNVQKIKKSPTLTFYRHCSLSQIQFLGSMPSSCFSTLLMDPPKGTVSSNEILNNNYLNNLQNVSQKLVNDFIDDDHDRLIEKKKKKILAHFHFHKSSFLVCLYSQKRQFLSLNYLIVPKTDLSIYLVTWNAGRSKTTCLREQLLKLLDLNENNNEILSGNINGSKTRHDIYAITIQESSSLLKNFFDIEENDFQCILDSIFASMTDVSYTKIESMSSCTTLLALYVREDLKFNIMDIKKTVINLDPIRPKSSNIISMLYQNIRIVFYGVHFHAGGSRRSLHNRIEDQRTTLQSTVDLDEDYAFFFGDLNFRIDVQGILTEPDIDNTIHSCDWPRLLAFDQLSAIRANIFAAHTFFPGFQEAEINFAPTYKMKIGSNKYSRKRKVAYTDRILFRERKAGLNAKSSQNSNIEVRDYESLSFIDLSDHRPVRAIATISLKRHLCSTKL